MGKLTGKLMQGTPGTLRRSLPALVRDERPVRSYARPRMDVYAKAVGSFVPKLTQKAFEKYGFSAATLLTDWAQIAGADVATYTVPERLKWPRGAGAFAETGEEDGRPGATLILRVDPARALDVEYRGRQIIERINAYFGYRAVATLKLIQAPVAVAHGTAPNSLAASPATQRGEAPGKGPQGVAGLDPADPLAQALARMEAGVMGHGSRGTLVVKPR